MSSIRLIVDQTVEQQKMAVATALGLVRKIENAIGAPSHSSEPMTGEDQRSLEVEIAAVRALLAQDDEPGSVAEALDKLFPAPVMLGSPINAPHIPPGPLLPSRSSVIAALASLRRLIETRLIYLEGRSGGQSDKTSESNGQDQPSPSEAEQDHHADALVQRASDRLLGSGQFRMLGILLAAAVALAGAGSLIIAGQTFFTAKDLRSTADEARKTIGDLEKRATDSTEAALRELRGTTDDAKKNINELVSASKTSAESQAHLIDAAAKAIDTSKNQFETTVANAKASVEEKAGAARTDLAGLKDRAVEEVVQKIQADLGKDAKPLHDRVEAAADDLSKFGNSSLKPLTESVTKLTEQTADLTTKTTAAGKAIDASKSQFEATVAAAKASVAAKASSAQSDLAGLKDRAVEEVVEKIQADLGKDSKPLHDRVEAAANAAAGKLNDFGSSSLSPLTESVTKLTQQTADLTKNTDAAAKAIDASKSQFETTVAAAKASVEAAANAAAGKLGDFGSSNLTPLIQSVAGLKQQVDADVASEKKLRSALDELNGLSDQLAKIKESVGQAADYAKAEADARSAATRASEDADQAQQHREAVFASLQSLDRNVSEGLTEFGVTKNKLENLSKQVSALHPALCDQSDNSPTGVQARLACVEQVLAALKLQMPAAPPPPLPPIEPVRGKKQWIVIQQALEKAGLHLTKIDGDPGDARPDKSETRSAIREWQRRNREPQTGRLTQAEIDKLGASLR